MTAILLPVLLGGAGVAIDISNVVLSQRQLQEASDSAALAAATALAALKVDQAGAQTLAQDFVVGQMANYLSGGEATSAALRAATQVTVTEVSNGASAKTYKVAVSTSYALPLTAFMQTLGYKTTQIAASGMTQSGHSETQGSLSMFLVLDRSGSMGEDTATVNIDNPTEQYSYDCSYKDKWGNTVKKTCTGTRDNYYTKIEALKLAVADLTGQLKQADPNKEYVRTGAVSYNDKMQTARALDWGTTGVTSYVNALTADGRTDSSAAFEKAYKSLSDAREDQAHEDKTGQTPTKYIVFMTDGDNNQTSADPETKKWCDKARADKMHVYTIAFMAPDRGKALLNYCATDPKHYFAAENMTALLTAFKSIGKEAAQQSTRLTQ